MKLELDKVIKPQKRHFAFKSLECVASKQEWTMAMF